MRAFLENLKRQPDAEEILYLMKNLVMYFDEHCKKDLEAESPVLDAPVSTEEELTEEYFEIDRMKSYIGFNFERLVDQVGEKHKDLPTEFFVQEKNELDEFMVRISNLIYHRKLKADEPEDQIYELIDKRAALIIQYENTGFSIGTPEYMTYYKKVSKEFRDYIDSLEKA